MAIETDRLIAADEGLGAGRGDRARARARSTSPSTSGRRRSAGSSRSSSRRRATRKEALDHVLLFGPPGLGKTTLAHIIAREMGVNLRQTSGPVLERAGDLAAILTNLEPNDVLFIDEIHRLLAGGRGDPLSGARGLPDRHHDRRGSGGALGEARPAALHAGGRHHARRACSPTRCATASASSRAWSSTRPRSSQRIVDRSARLLEVEIADEGALEIARRSRGTPRIANRLLRRVRDYAAGEGAGGAITREVADAALTMLDVDAIGLDVMDRKLLLAVIEKFGGGPVGVENLAAAIGEERDTIEDVLEPFLIQQGYLQRTPRGRVATLLAYRHFGLAAPRRPARESCSRCDPDRGAQASTRSAAPSWDVRSYFVAGARVLPAHRRRRRRLSRRRTSISWSARAPSCCSRSDTTSRTLAREHGSCSWCTARRSTTISPRG